MSEFGSWERKLQNWYEQFAGRIKETLKGLYQWLNRVTGGVPRILGTTFGSFGEARGSEAAAGMAYYALFSLFPLTLALVAIGGFFLERQQAVQQTILLIRQAFPVSQSLIVENIQQVLELRGTVGLIGLVGTLWSASGFFTILTRNVNRAWPSATARGFWARRLIALTMIGILFGLLLVSLLSRTALNLLSQLQIPLGDSGSISDTPLWLVASTLVPWLLTLVLFTALYRWVPNTQVPGWAALWPAVVVSAVWQIGAGVFAWYVGSGLAPYRVVYGSLGTIIALIFWIYLSNWLIVFGAHLSAAIAQRP
ncbi:MAG: YihY/virulence factor BrkB family protein [Anaerolineae bacterium]|nr:YihY/virulence factor BrkB family protein [Anaerolineae bacterium]